MANKYPNIPGVNVNVKDGQLLLTENRSANSILIIAEARTNREVPDGPVYISSEQEMIDNFGNFFHKGQVNPIAVQWLTAHQNGFGNIYLMALSSGEDKDKFADLYDKLFGVMADLAISHVALDGLYSNEKVEGLTPEDFGLKSDDDIPASLPAYFVRTAETAPAAPLEPVNLTIEDNAQSQFVLTIDAEDFVEDKLNVEGLNHNLQEAITLGYANFEAELKLDETGNVIFQSSSPVVLSGADALTTLGLTDVEEEIQIEGNPAVLLANFAEQVSQELGGTIAYIAAKPPLGADLTSIKAYVDDLVAQDNQISPYLQVVAGPQVGITVPGSLRTQWVSGLIHYVSLVNGLMPQYSPTNQILPGARNLRFNFSPRQLNDLIGNKYVTFRSKNGQIRVVDAVTTARDLSIGEDIVKSDFTRLSTLRIMNHVVRRVREACEDFIGSPNEFIGYNGMNTAIKAVFDEIIEQGIILDARYSIRLGDTLDSANIDITVLPQFELRTVNATIALSTPENF